MCTRSGNLGSTYLGRPALRCKQTNSFKECGAVFAGVFLLETTGRNRGIKCTLLTFDNM
jgi:hypothetical protein